MPSPHSSSSHSSSSHSSGSASRSSGSYSSHSSSSHSSSWGSSRSSDSSWGSSRSSDSFWGSSRSSDSSWDSDRDRSRRPWSSENSRSRRASDSDFSSGTVWGLSAAARNAGRGPSAHSRTSRSSEPVRSHYVRSGSMRGTVIDRKRVNQPQGYLSGLHDNVQPVTHFCVRHNYLYYPFGWTDYSTGKEYQKGYYDEEGQYYEDVVFLSDGKYKDVVCQCEYCGTVTKLDWTEGSSLICPQCGGAMRVLSVLDEYTRDPLYDQTRRQPGYVDYADREDAASRSAAPGTTEQSGSDGKRKSVWIIGILALLALIVLVFAVVKLVGAIKPGVPSNPALFGKTIFLRRGSYGGYVISDSGSYEKKLVWDSGEACYYDDESELWLWYNNEVEPSLWQYWYEPISGDYGGQGWMEYERGQWYIESYAGNWIKVPETYDTTPLWYIESDITAPTYPPFSVVTRAAGEDEDTAEDLAGDPLSNDTPEDLPVNDARDDDTPEDLGG